MMYNIIIKQRGRANRERSKKSKRERFGNQQKTDQANRQKNRSSPKILKKSARAEKQKKGCHSPQKSPQPKGSL